MDIDPAPLTAKALLTPIPESTPVVCLPYSLVPGMDITSQSYQKAVITLGKQKINSAPLAKDVPLISVLDRGMFLVPSLFPC